MMHRPPPLRWRAAVAAAALLLLLPIAWPGPAVERSTATAQVAPHPAKADELLIVDCLLPGQVRRLGSRLTILTARRAMKTSQRDCEIRGGEYVSYDRANYATALKVWLASAEGGDTAAQTYVGEIYEKGLGVPPDYVVAARWYKRAADAGFPRAAINLGHLYEHGLGVPRDPALALDLYKRASGQTPLSFAIAPPAAEPAGEVQRLRGEIADLRRQLETSRLQLEHAQGELDTARRSVEQRRKEVDAERAELERLRKSLNESRLEEQAAAGQRDLERALAERERQLTLRERELTERGRADAERQRAAIEGERGELARLRQELEDSRNRERTATAGQQELERMVAEREARFAARERELTERSRAEAERQRGAMEQERGELARLRQELADSRTKERTAAASQRALERAVAEREAQFVARERELRERSRAEADRQRAETERERAELARLRKELEDSRGKERTATGGLRDLERAVTEREARLAAKEREVAELRAAVSRTEADAAARRAALEREAAGLRATLAKLEADSSARRASAPPPSPQVTASVASPVIELIEPELVATRDPGIQSAHLAAPTSSVVVLGRVRSASGLKSLTVNGREETVDPQNLFKAQVAMRNPEERVRIVAVDSAGKKSTLEFFLVDPGSRRAAGGGDDGARIGHAKAGGVSFGNYHALVIGINDYRLMRPLKTAVHDAREIARVLGTEYGFKTTVLVNASRYDILSALNTLRERLTDKDNLLIYYAGHGQLDQLNQRGHWLPIDAEPESSANWISNIAITDVLNAMTIRQLLVVSDSCYSGALTRSALGQLEGGMSEQQLAQVMMSMAQKRSRLVLTSGGLEPVLDGGGGAHSLFARTFLDLLRANQGVLPGQELFRHLRLRVAAQAERARVSQVPEYAPIKYAGHEAGDFIFVRATN